ncbi:MAG: hypothetical protein ABIH08_06900, partial [Candidatus Omnitrophota bacterium]
NRLNFYFAIKRYYYLLSLHSERLTFTGKVELAFIAYNSFWKRQSKVTREQNFLGAYQELMEENGGDILIIFLLETVLSEFKIYRRAAIAQRLMAMKKNKPFLESIKEEQKTGAKHTINAIALVIAMVLDERGNKDFQDEAIKKPFITGTQKLIFLQQAQALRKSGLYREYLKLIYSLSEISHCEAIILKALGLPGASMIYYESACDHWKALFRAESAVENEPMLIQRYILPGLKVCCEMAEISRTNQEKIKLLDSIEKLCKLFLNGSINGYEDIARELLGKKWQNRPQFNKFLNDLSQLDSFKYDLNKLLVYVEEQKNSSPIFQTQKNMADQFSSPIREKDYSVGDFVEFKYSRFGSLRGKIIKIGADFEHTKLGSLGPWALVDLGEGTLREGVSPVIRIYCRACPGLKHVAAHRGGSILFQNNKELRDDIIKKYTKPFKGGIAGLSKLIKEYIYSQPAGRKNTVEALTKAFEIFLSCGQAEYLESSEMAAVNLIVGDILEDLKDELPVIKNILDKGRKERISFAAKPFPAEEFMSFIEKQRGALITICVFMTSSGERIITIEGGMSLVHGAVGSVKPVVFPLVSRVILLRAGADSAKVKSFIQKLQDSYGLNPLQKYITLKGSAENLKISAPNGKSGQIFKKGKMIEKLIVEGIIDEGWLS